MTEQNRATRERRNTTVGVALTFGAGLGMTAGVLAGGGTGIAIGTAIVTSALLAACSPADLAGGDDDVVAIAEQHEMRPREAVRLLPRHGDGLGLRLERERPPRLLDAVAQGHHAEAAGPLDLRAGAKRAPV